MAEKVEEKSTLDTKGSFKGKVKDIKKFVDAMLSVGEIIDEGVFRITENGIKLIAADRAMVAVCDFTYKKEGFESFDFKSDGELLVGLNVQDLMKTIKRFSGAVTFECDSDDNKFYIYDEEKKFNIPMLDISVEDIPPIAQLIFSGELEMDIAKLREITEDTQIVADALIFDVKTDDINIKASGDVKGYNIHLKSSVSFEKETKAMFSLDYFAKVLKSNIAEKIKLSLATDHPIRLFSESEETSLTWVLAPRVLEE